MIDDRNGKYRTQKRTKKAYQIVCQPIIRLEYTEEYGKRLMSKRDGWLHVLHLLMNSNEMRSLSSVAFAGAGPGRAAVGAGI